MQKHTKKNKEARHQDDELIRGGGEENVNETGTGEAYDQEEAAHQAAAGDEEERTGADDKIAELNDKYIRLYSEFDNYRKRTIKEKVELSKTAAAEVITELLPVLDDFERAIKAFSATNGSDASLKEGIILIFNKFLNLLTQKGLEQMKTIGEPFDTDFHEAITNIPAPSPDMKGKVVDEIEKGYLLNGKVIRYAKVVVGS